MLCISVHFQYVISAKLLPYDCYEKACMTVLHKGNFDFNLQSQYCHFGDDIFNYVPLDELIVVQHHENNLSPGLNLFCNVIFLYKIVLL